MGMRGVHGGRSETLLRKTAKGGDVKSPNGDPKKMNKRMRERITPLFSPNTNHPYSITSSLRGIQLARVMEAQETSIQVRL